MRKYEYMVVYQHNTGVGRMQIITTKKVESYEDVEKLDQTIRNSNKIMSSFVTNFKLLREFDEN